MWVEILCGLVAYKIIRRVFFSDDDLDQLADLDSSHSHLCLAVASRLEKLYAGRCFVGLRIPDPDAGARQHVDVVLVTKREVMVVAIKNCSGFVEVDKDGNWSCPSDKKHKQEVFPNPVLEVNRLAANLQSYLEQRGATLPDGHITGRVVLPNPNCRPSYTITLQPEVITHDQWKDRKADSPSRNQLFLEVLTGLRTARAGDFRGRARRISQTAAVAARPPRRNCTGMPTRTCAALRRGPLHGHTGRARRRDGVSDLHWSSVCGHACGRGPGRRVWCKIVCALRLCAEEWPHGQLQPGSKATFSAAR